MRVDIMTPEPQANKLGEINKMCNLNGLAHISTRDKLAIQALITEARANERQALLDAVHKKIPDSEEDVFSKVYQGGFNQAIDQMESAIKLRGGSK